MDKVRSQYERWIYPAPVDDLVAWTAGGGITIGDAKDFADLYWPDTGYREGMNILVAGCGANQAARYAFVHPGASVTGIDLSEASLAHGDKLKKKHGLGNLTLKQMRLEDAGKLDAEFDFIACSGVLHHLPDPLAGLKALGGVLASDGVIYVMLYGRYGRAPVYMMQDLFRLLGTQDQSEDDVALVKATLQLLPPEHPLRTYAKRSSDMKFDAGLVDLFLHKQDRPYSVGECLELTRDAGLDFQAWIEPTNYNPDGHVPDTHPLYLKLDALGDEERWRAMELIGGFQSRHDFCVCRSDRPAQSYRMDFTQADFPDRAIPLARGVSLTPATAGKPATLTGQRAPPLTLPPPLVAIFRQVDGKRSIRQCIEASGNDLPAAELLGHGLRFFRSLSRTGHVVFRLNTKVR